MANLPLDSDFLVTKPVTKTLFSEGLNLITHWYYFGAGDGI